MQIYRHFISNEWVDSVDGQRFETENPFTGKPWALLARGSDRDADKAVAAAREAFEGGEWPELTPTARGALLYRLADLIERDAERLARIETQDNGKLLAEMLGQLKYIPQWYRYFGGLADKIEGAVLPSDKPHMFNYTKPEPLGVVALIIPWNSPLLVVAFKLAPALAAGNTVVVKPSEFASASLLEMLDLIVEAGFPPGVVNAVTGLGGEVGRRLVEHPDVAKIAFTGSDANGRKIYQAAADRMIPVTMELGGKSPNIVFADADLDNAVNGVMSAIFAASGQSCLAGSRLLVQRSIHDEFVDRVVAAARSIRLGDPTNESTQMGPLATRPQFAKVLESFDLARKEGAKFLLGGRRSDQRDLSDGLFVEPTIIAGLDNSARIAREEVFGPVLTILPFEDEDEAIAIANDTPYGLASGVWTSDMNRAFRMADAIRAGTVWINTYRAVSYLSPFGGFKQSGLGRENGQEAIRSYLQTKSVWISTSDAPVPNPFILR